MAKNENEFAYGSSFLPQGEKKYSVIRWGWNGLNRTDDIDTGQLSDAQGVMIDPPYVYPAKKPFLWFDFSDGVPVTDGTPVFFNDMSSLDLHIGTPISLFGKDEILGMVWRDEEDNKFRFCELRNANTLGRKRFVIDTTLGDTTGTDSDLIPRSIIQFNVADTHTGNIVTYDYDRKILIYPDCYSISYDYNIPLAASNFNSFGTIPVSNIATAYGSRVFGMTKDAVFASAFNSYVDYNLDTADNVSSAHAWWSMAGSNAEADGKFTAMITYDNHVVLFRKDFMQLVYNDKNPFRIVDIGNYGCDNVNAVAIMGGVLYFVSQNKVYAFTGGTPKDISKKLDIQDLSGAVLGSYKDTLWMQTNDTIYTFKDGVWSDVGNLIGSDSRVVQFATLDYGIVGLVKEHIVTPGDPAEETDHYSLWWFDWDIELMDPVPSDVEEWEPDYSDAVWWFETDLMVLGRLDIRRVKKMSVLCDGMEDAEIHVCLLPDGIKIKDFIPYEESDPDTRKLLEEYKVGDITFIEDGIRIMRVLTRQFSSTMHRLFFYGKGFVKVYAAELKISWGGDLYVEG